MIVLRAWGMALALVLSGALAAWAQFPPPPNPSANPFPPPPVPGSAAPAQSSPFPPPGAVAAPQASPFPPQGPAAPAGKNPCEAFMPIRAAAEKDAAAIQAAGKRKAPREELCPLFRKFALAESKMVKFLQTHQTTCRVPADAVKQARVNHNQTIKIRNQVCSAGPAPAAPRLSDAFGGPTLPGTRPGRGTFDTLTGNPFKQ
jgi:hypothetical protein